MKKVQRSPIITELLWLLAMSWVARDGSVVELRDAPVRGLAGYGHSLLAFTEYLRQEQPSLWHKVHNELVAEQEPAGSLEDDRVQAPGFHIKRRAYHAQMARLLRAVVEPEASQPTSAADALVDVHRGGPAGT